MVEGWGGDGAYFGWQNSEIGLELDPGVGLKSDWPCGAEGYTIYYSRLYRS